MELLGLVLGLMSTILFGSADVIAAGAARRLRTFKATLVSEAAGFLTLFLCGLIVYTFLPLPFTPTAITVSILIGVVTGVFAALGSFSLYRALEAGPIALVSPITSTNSVFTLLLSFFILREDLTGVQLAVVGMIIVGILLASTHLHEIRSLLQTPGFPFWNRGVCWAIIAAVAFGLMDFGIGACASLSGWFLPVLWTRIFSVCFLTFFSYWKRWQRAKRLQVALRAQPHPQEAANAALAAKATPCFPGASPRDDLETIDPDVTWVAPWSRRRRRAAPFDPEATLLYRPSRHLGALASTIKNSSSLKLLGTSLEDTLTIRSFRSQSRALTLIDHANPQTEKSHPDPAHQLQNIVPVHLDGTPSSNSTLRTISLSLPSLEDLSHLRRPLASMLGMGLLLAIFAGVAENVATLIFSLNTQITTTGVAAVIASGYSLIVLLFGITVYHERLTRNQIGGMIMFMSGLILLCFL